jgi:hypothetical protein
LWAGALLAAFFVVRGQSMIVWRGSMIRRRALFTAAGSLAMAVGIGLQLSMDSSLAHFAGGFFLGASIALLILGLAQPSRRVSR